MTNYYLLTWKHTPKGTSAIAPEDADPKGKLIPSLEGKKSLPFVLELRKITETKNGITESEDLSGLSEIWVDYQPNDLGLPMMSAELKKVIEDNLTGNEETNWIKCKIRGGDETREYFILRFTKRLQVLDKENTLYIPGTKYVVKPVFLLQKISKYAIFPKDSGTGLWKITSSLIISESLKKAIQKSRITGVSFEKVAVS